MPPTRRLTLLAALLFVALIGAACRTEQITTAPSRTPRATAGPPRAYLMGFSATPSELTDAAYQQTFDLAANYGEVLLIQRAPAWSSFLPGASIAAGLRDQTLSDREAAKARGLTLMVALDVFDPASRDRLNGLPADEQGKQLDDPHLRQALVDDAVFVARNEHPAFLAIGSEVNATFERNPAAYAQFLTAYAQAYDAVKQIAPDIQVFPTFQYEELLGVIPWEPPHAPRWELLDQFKGRMDLVAITTYPSFAYQVARKVPPLYYRQIRDHSSLPVAFASVGYSSGQVREGFNSSTPPEQRRFVQRLFDDANWLGSPLVIWFAAQDLSFATAPPYDLLAHIGLRDTKDQPKEAWATWVEESRRPYDPAAAEAARQAAASATPTPEGTGTPAASGTGTSTETP